MTMSSGLRIAVTASAVLLTVGFAAVSPTIAQEQSPPVSNGPLTAEQLAVYRAVLTGWFESEKFSVNLSELTTVSTSPVEGDENDDAACGKGLALEPRTNEVHKFRQEDLPQLGLGAHIQLVDPDTHANVVRGNDPGNAIRDGKPVDAAVKEGFAHGLFTLGEVRFDKSHTHAVISFSFWCGSLCGHGSTMLMEKKNGKWTPRKQCGGWIS